MSNGGAYKLRIDEKDIIRGRLMQAQNFQCPICGMSLKAAKRGGPVLDHCHDHKFVRGTLCKVCNTGEGVIKKAAIRYGNGKANYVQWLKNLAAYLEHHQVPRTRYIYPEPKKRKRKVVKK